MHRVAGLLLLSMGSFAAGSCGANTTQTPPPAPESLGGSAPKEPSPAAAESRALYDQAFGEAESGRFDAASRLFQQALEVDPGNFLAAFDLGGVHEATGDKERALERYLEAAKIEPTFIEAVNQAATILLIDKGQPEEAIRLWKQVVLLRGEPYIDRRFSKAHTLGQTFTNLSVAYAVQGLYGLAQGVARSYLNDPRVDRSSAQQMRTMISRTEADMKRTAVRRYAAELASLSKTLYGGEPQAARDGYREFQRKHPEDTLGDLDRWDLVSGIAMANALLRDNGAAEEFFAKAVEASAALEYSKKVESHFNLACALSLQGKLDASLRQAELVLWFETITGFDPVVTPDRRYAPRLLTNPTLSNLREHGDFNRLLESYSMHDAP